MNYKRKLHGLCVAGVAMAASATHSAAAQQYQSVYLYPAARYAYSDSARQANNAYGYQFSIGYAFDKRWGVELVSETDRFKLLSDVGAVNVHGLGVQGTFNFLPNADLSPFLLVGGSWLRTDLGGRREDAPATRGGLGVQYQPEGSALGFRADAVARHEFLNALNPQKNNFDDLIYSIGLTYRFGVGAGATQTAGYTAPLGNYVPQSQPTQKAAVASSEPAAKSVRSSFRGRVSTGVPTPNDSDGDGIPNSQDKCSDTPANAVVDADGCIVYLKKI